MASVKVSERIEAAAKDVWELLRDFGGVQRFSPGIEACSVDGEGVGSVRTLTLAGGIRLQERLERFDDAGRTLQYSIVGGPLPFEGYLSTLSVVEEENGCRIEWGSRFEPRGVSEEQARTLVEGIYRGGIAGVRQTLGA